MKKLILTIVLSFGLIGVIITSCICKDVQDYWMPESMSASVIHFNYHDGAYEENDTIATDSVDIRINLDYIFLSKEGDDFYNFGNSAFASQPCPIDGNEGIKYGVQSFEITSNKDYDSIPAGENLSDMLFLDQEPMSSAYTKSFNMIDMMFSDAHYGDQVIFTLKHKPSTAESRIFTLTWTFDNDLTISASTQPVVW